jgi:hypothetical protein
MSIICEGCNKFFSTKQGFTTHLRLTKRPACRDIFESAEANTGISFEPDTGENGDSTPDRVEQFGILDELGLPQGHSHFEGDYFGSGYTAQQLGYDEDEPMDEDDEPQGDRREDFDDEDDDHNLAQAAANLDLERAYEPERPNAPQSEPVGGADHAYSASAEPSTPSVPRIIHSRKIFEDAFHRKPVIERFPSSLAGAPLSDKRDATSEELYHSDIETSANNPYAPFTSKTDWEIARWAKLRGSGSTAFTDLLKIDGVRLLCAPCLPA